MFSGQSPRHCSHIERASRPRCVDPPEAIPVEVSGYWPHHQFELDQEKCASNLRSAPRGSAAGLAGDTNEHHKVMLDDEEATHLITEAALQYI